MGLHRGAVLSAGLLVLNSYTKKYDLGELAQKHRQAGGDLWLIREHYLSLLVDVRMHEKPFEALQKNRDHKTPHFIGACQQLSDVYRGARSKRTTRRISGPRTRSRLWKT
jgi:hypothetical protein